MSHVTTSRDTLAKALRDGLGLDWLGMPGEPDAAALTDGGPDA